MLLLDKDGCSVAVYLGAFGKQFSKLNNFVRQRVINLLHTLFTLNFDYNISYLIFTNFYMPSLRMNKKKNNLTTVKV